MEAHRGRLYDVQHKVRQQQRMMFPTSIPVLHLGPYDSLYSSYDSAVVTLIHPISTAAITDAIFSRGYTRIADTERLRIQQRVPQAQTAGTIVMSEAALCIRKNAVEVTTSTTAASEASENLASLHCPAAKDSSSVIYSTMIRADDSTNANEAR